MGCEAGWSKICTPYDIFIMTPSLEKGCQSRLKFSPWGMTGPAGHQPSILMSWGGAEFNVSWALKISAHYVLRYNLVGAMADGIWPLSVMVGGKYKY